MVAVLRRVITQLVVITARVEAATPYPQTSMAAMVSKRYYYRKKYFEYLKSRHQRMRC